MGDFQKSLMLEYQVCHIFHLAVFCDQVVVLQKYVLHVGARFIQAYPLYPVFFPDVFHTVISKFHHHQLSLALQAPYLQPVSTCCTL